MKKLFGALVKLFSLLAVLGALLYAAVDRPGSMPLSLATTAMILSQ